MLADLDLLLICGVLRRGRSPARATQERQEDFDGRGGRHVCVAQALMGIPSDERFLRVARKRFAHLFPVLPKRPRFHTRRARLADTLEVMIGQFASESPGFHDDPVLVDSTPVECARSIRRHDGASLADAADYGSCASHSRYFWGFRLRTLDGTPRDLQLTSPKASERDVCLQLLRRVQRDGHLAVVIDKGYAGREFEHAAAELDATVCRPRRKDEPGQGPHLASIRLRIESNFQTCKDVLTLERHGARTLNGLRTRISSRFLALAAATNLDHRLGRPPRTLIDYVA